MIDHSNQLLAVNAQVSRESFIRITFTPFVQRFIVLGRYR